MTRDEAEVVLEAGGTINYEAWEWDRWYMQCGSNNIEGGGTCCEEHFDSVEDALDNLERMCEGNWEDVV